MLFAGLLASEFGGMAFARERKDCTADFMALLPVSRVQILASKLVVGGVSIIASTVIPMIVGVESFEHQFVYDEHLSFIWKWESWAGQTTILFGFALELYTFACMVTALFGVAWLLSTFSESSVVSTCTSLAITLAMFVLTEFNGKPDYTSRQLVISLSMLALGLPGLFAGTIFYVRRISP